ncbi:penicillin-binding transpeptidase domain-containing protein [Streptomyces sp. NPDC000410]|uniref:penicillin-binding transpeptidase domain-containing protein n=1 Tax=Streptomyces sp. NPDC000410 TaxID=3154254 RepID=UPI00331BC220
MHSTIKRHTVHAALLALLLVPATGCTDGSSSPPSRAEPVPGTTAADGEGLGDVIVGGRPVTGSKPSGNAKVPYRRTYTDGQLYASVTGYRSMAYGRTGLEALYDDVLAAGNSGRVVTTIDPAVQKAAADALKGRRGAAIALEVGSGRVLGLVSAPSFDPSLFSGAGAVDEATWQKLQGDADKPMLNRPLRKAVEPGGTFGVVVAAAALEEGLYASVDEHTRSPKRAADAARCENASIRSALRYSCDNVFAGMAVELGHSRLAAMAEAFGFNDAELAVPVRAAESVYPTGDVSAADLALTGAGQGGVTATPLEMARVMAVVAGGGKLVAPHMVASPGRPRGSGGAGTEQTIRQKTAAELRSALESAAADAAPGGTVLGGTTGSAVAPAAAWFVSYARSGSGDGGKLIAMAVCVEGGDEAVAVRVAEAMGKAAS